MYLRIAEHISTFFLSVVAENGLQPHSPRCWMADQHRHRAVRKPKQTVLRGQLF